jgi:hypothetical protein
MHNTKEEMKNWIDNASYIALLSRWRFHPSGDPIFQAEIGEYYSEVMARKRGEVGDEAHVRASKAIGWGN